MEYVIGTKVFGEWVITREIGEGANGKVFELQKQSFGVSAKSVLKVIRIPKSKSEIDMARNEGMDDKSVTSYFRGFVEEIVKEISIMTSLKGHPHIVCYEDHDVVAHEGGIGWDVLVRMELLTPMTEYLRRHAMREADVIRMGLELSSALEYCQSKGLIHRDIKPQNVFVNDMGQFKLGDFGEARIVEKTMSGLSRKGTESYMAPEVYKNEDYGPTVDIYSLGLMLYNLTNHGRLPFFPAAPSSITYGDREKALSRRMRGEEVPMPAGASAALGKVIQKACQYDPMKRYRSATQLHQALEQLASGTVSDPVWEEEEEKTVGSWGKSTAFSEKPQMTEDTNEFEDKTVGVFDQTYKPREPKPTEEEIKAAKEKQAAKERAEKERKAAEARAAREKKEAQARAEKARRQAAAERRAAEKKTKTGGSEKKGAWILIVVMLLIGGGILLYTKLSGGFNGSEGTVDMGETYSKWTKAAESFYEDTVLLDRHFTEVSPAEYARTLEGKNFGFSVGDTTYDNVVWELPENVDEVDVIGAVCVMPDTKDFLFGIDRGGNDRMWWELYISGEDVSEEDQELFRQYVPTPSDICFGMDIEAVFARLGISKTELDATEHMTGERGLKWTDESGGEWTLYWIDYSTGILDPYPYFAISLVCENKMDVAFRFEGRYGSETYLEYVRVENLN